MSATHCDVHQLPWKTVPAGTSTKTGMPYPAFQACSVRGCDQRPPKVTAQAAPRTVPASSLPSAPQSEAQVRLVAATAAWQAAIALLASGPSGGPSPEDLAQRGYAWIMRAYAGQSAKPVVTSAAHPAVGTSPGFGREPGDPDPDDVPDFQAGYPQTSFQ